MDIHELKKSWFDWTVSAGSRAGLGAWARWTCCRGASQLSGDLPALQGMDFVTVNRVLLLHDKVLTSSGIPKDVMLISFSHV